VQVLWHRKAFVLLGAFVGLALGFLYHSQRSPVYQTSCQILVIQKRAQQVLPASGVNPGTLVVEDYTATHVALLRSPLRLERAVKKGELTSLKTFENVADPAGLILANLTVTRDTKETGGAPNNIIVLTFRGPVAEDCGKVLTAVLESYQEFLDITYRNVNDETLRLIQSARDTLKNELGEAEKKLVEFRKKSPLLTRGKEGVNVEQERLLAIEADRTQLLLKQAKLHDRIRALQDAIKEGKGLDVLIAVPIGATRDGKPVAAERYVEEPLLPLLMEEQRLLEDFGDFHPQVKNVRKRIEKMRQHLSRISPEASEKDPAKRTLHVLQYELTETELTLKSITEFLDRTKTEARAQMDYEIAEGHLRNEVVRAGLIYDGTVKRLQEINLVRDSAGGFDARPLSTPGVGAKVAPIAYQDLGLGLILGLLLGAGLAYLAEYSDKSFRNPEEIRRRLGLPLVGHIPYISPDADAERKRGAGECTVDPFLCTYFRPKSLEAEAYRAVRTALFFASQGLGHKVIQVTSPNKSDGKSLMTANLAVMVAQSGKRVLVIDADLRRPRQHKVFGIEATAGLAAVLAGNAQAGDVTCPTCVPGLSIMPCGAVPPNPSELLTSPRFKELLESARTEYDYVLVDTPPLLAVTDPCVVAGRVDGLFLTIRLTRKGRPDAERAREILAGLSVKIYGIVVNGISRGTAGIYSPHVYDYTETYDEDEPDGSGDYYYYEQEDPTREAVAAAPANANGEAKEATNAHRDAKETTAANGASHRVSGKGFWGRWWPGT
jgi:capsular exopolysaccharide synthesis family protein